MPASINGKRILHRGWSTFLIADVTFPNGERHEREIEDHGVAVCVLPYDPARRVALLIEQFRAPVFYAESVPALLEAPAGILDEQDPEAGTRREALEETGVQLGQLEPVSRVWAMPGISTERMHLYLAAYTEADRIGAGGGLPDEGEDIRVLEMPLAELARLADEGGIVDVKTLVLVQTLRLRHGDLFSGS